MYSGDFGRVLGHLKRSARVFLLEAIGQLRLVGLAVSFLDGGDLREAYLDVRWQLTPHLIHALLRNRLANVKLNLHFTAAELGDQVVVANALHPHVIFLLSALCRIGILTEFGS